MIITLHFYLLSDESGSFMLIQYSCKVNYNTNIYLIFGASISFILNLSAKVKGIATLTKIIQISFATSLQLLFHALFMRPDNV